MTIKEFAIKTNKKEKTVIEWLCKEYIPGAKIVEDRWFIPIDARVPYTERGKVTGYALYKSIVKAYDKGKSTTPSLYGISESMYEEIHIQLIERGLIIKYSIDGVDYYDVTDQGHNFCTIRNTTLYKMFQDTVGSVTYGATNANK